MPSSPTPSKPIPEDEFAVLKERGRNDILHSGRYSDMDSLAAIFNEEYQTDSYFAERWNSNRIY